MSGLIRRDTHLQAGAAHLATLTETGRFSLFALTLHGEALQHEGETVRGFWVAHVAGRGSLRGEVGHLAFSSGDLLYGHLCPRMFVTDAEELRLQGAFFRAEKDGRLASLPMPQTAALLPRERPGSALLGTLLATAVGRMDTLEPTEVRPLELALLEFLTAAVRAHQLSARVVPGSAGRNAIALRAQQAIELLLSDPGLSPALIARRIGVSLRYLQQIFAGSGEHPNQYIRRRRLERTHADLRDPLYAGQSIAEISQRWGFLDQAYFSRVFKEHFGLSPSAHRAARRRAARAA